MTTKSSTPEDFAKALSKRFGIAVPVNLQNLAGKIGLEIREVTADGFEGTLICAEDKPIGIIAVNENIREVERKRFTVAHEIGHYILPGHGERDCICNSNEIESWSRELPEEEIAANRFASELLMPSGTVSQILRQEQATISAAKLISQECKVSLTAAVVRVIDLTDEKCALIVSDNGVIKWFRPSKNFDAYIPIRINVSTDSVAYRLYQGQEYLEMDEAVAAEAWISGYQAGRIGKVWEDSILLKRYGRVLSVITIRT